MTTSSSTTQPLPSSATVGVIGAGTMGQGIAALALRAGHPVCLHDTRNEALESAAQAIATSLGRWVKRGEINTTDQAECLKRLQLAGHIEALAGCSLVVEAIIEDLTIKTSLFQTLETLVGEHTILASNTSSISITAIGAGLRLPERLVGMHFFNPATVLPLVEVVSGEATDLAIAQTITATARAWGKSPVPCRSTPGFIVNRVARPFYGEALLALQEGACDAATLDAALRDAGGFRMGPLELMDLIGHDTNFAVTRSVYNAFFQDPRYQPSLLQQALVEAGWLGRKSGRGFHRYDPDAVKAPLVLAAPGVRPAHVTLEGEFPGTRELLAMAAAHELTINCTPGAGRFVAGDLRLEPSRGRTATALAAEEACNELVLFDASVDYAKASLVVLAKADQCSAQGLAQAVGFFQALGKQVLVIDDVPGLLVTRTLCMLANEAAEAVCHGIATAEDVDQAMLKGVNYPVGPLAWADTYGCAAVVTVLDNLASAYPTGRYRPSALLRRKAATYQRWYKEGVST